MKDCQETGRSMVEMLGVLCVIGALVVGGTWGYAWGMNKYRSYKIIEGLQQRMLLAGFGRRPNYNALSQKSQIEENLMGYSVSFDAAFTDAELNVENAKKITILGMEQKACQSIMLDDGLVSLSQEPNTMVLINEKQLSKSSLCSNTQGNSLSIIIQPSVAEETSVDSTEYCVYLGSPYRSGQSVNQCGVCNGGTVINDPTKGTVCQVCNSADWSLSNIDDGKMKQEDGRCCIKGQLAYHAVLCPEPASSCTFKGQKYSDKATVGTCGKCNANKIEVDPTKYNSECQRCDQGTYTVVNKAGTCDYDGGVNNGLCAKGECISCSGWIDALGNCCPDSPECSEECQTTDQCTNDHVCSGGHCVCPASTFETKGRVCKDCSDSYRSEATETECDKCGPERIFVASGNKGFCDWVCPDDWFRNDNRNCTHCGFTSARATSKEECDKCTGDLARTWDENTRLCGLPGGTCPSGYFMSSGDSICRPCSSESSFAATQTECNKCNGERMMLNKQCILTGTCPDGYFWVTGTKTCLSCSDLNATQTDEKFCNDCGSKRWYGIKDGIGKAGFCEPSCPSGWYQNKNGNCTDCGNATPKETTQSQCETRCVDTVFERQWKSSDKKCYLNNKPEGYFKDNGGVYRSCSDPKTYKPNPASECGKCGDLREIVDGNCVLK